MCGFLENDPRVLNLFVVLIKLGEVDPEAGQFAHRLLGLNGLHCLGEGVDHLPGLPLQQVHPLLPLSHVVRILSQQDRIEKQRPSEFSE